MLQRLRYHIFLALINMLISFSNCNFIIYNYQTIYIRFITGKYNMDNITTSKKRSDNNFKLANQAQKIQLSIHSQGRIQNQLESSQKFFSFNQSFTNVEQGDKLLHQKYNLPSKVKSLEEELKMYKAKSSLWEKVKLQIVNLNKFLRLSSLSLGCSDSSLMKQFFQSITQVLQRKDNTQKQQRSLVADSKKKESQLFQKLVQSNKRKYELQQKIVQYQHQISKLSQVNESLRQKSRAQSTERSSKIKQFHEETILTIHQKQAQVTTLEDKNDELKRQVIKLQSELSSLKSKLQSSEQQFAKKIDNNQQLYLQCQQYKNEINKLKKQEEQMEIQIYEIKDSLNRIVQQNMRIRIQLTKKAECICTLKTIIEQAKSANDKYLEQIQQITKQQENKKKQNIQKLLQSQVILKTKLKNNPRFAINNKTKKKKQLNQYKKESLLLLPSQQMLI